LAFLDDDACAAPDWLARAAEASKRAKLFGGRDLSPPGAPLSERISDLLLATPWIGSRVAAHERGPRSGPIRRPSDLALCNLFVSRTLFDSLGGFDEDLGYIGEDTDFVARAIAAGEIPELDPQIVVFHDRRKFPSGFLRQRWRYRWKTGRLLVLKPSSLPKALIYAFLLAGLAAGVSAVLLGGRFLAVAAGVYALATWALSYSIWRRDPVLFPIVPPAFAVHHANYWIATVAGILAGGAQAVFGRRSTSAGPVAKAAR
jgi:GT2 family glycosyltransferase